MGATSEHFSDKELACPHCGVNECKPELVAALEELRKITGPIIVTSGFRCITRNADVGGAKFSQHTIGKAADIRVKGKTARQLEVLARQVPAIRGIGRNDEKGFLHVDVREIKAQWCYKGNSQCLYYA